ncbi:Transglycosylase SLT domain-containing protein [Nitrosospira sp. Nsp11]|uniref:lytic transglycosylase domain-containing protein n=1 Tax=Nitrosospira sp. Nsp11 TaxID=1855338 RepID=UPI000912A19F|nr:lytic transglycosylase domain-containing protein [Nitrosospira sp. Nsp11]SHL44878.1 Transglycosylase SLT domain-containing protein [Nitrosospira sp. Nsp11]
MKSDALIFVAAGLLAGIAAWKAADASVDAGEYEPSGVDSISDVIDDFTFDNFGISIMSNWRDDLAGRGAAYAPLLAAAEVRHGIPGGMLARLAWQESRFRADIISGRTVSSAGALGIMQIVPKWHPGVDPLNPAAAINYAGGYLASLYRQFSRWDLALKAYNWGPGNVRAWLNGQKVEPTETRLYSAQILNDMGAIA